MVVMWWWFGGRRLVVVVVVGVVVEADWVSERRGDHPEAPEKRKEALSAYLPVLSDDSDGRH